MAVELKPDTLALAKEEGRASWTDVVHEFKDCVWYNDGFPVTEGHSPIVSREASQQNPLRCFDLALKIANDNVQRGIISRIQHWFKHGRICRTNLHVSHVHPIPRKDGDCEDPNRWSKKRDIRQRQL